MKNQNRKAYFVDNETYDLYELSIGKRKELEEKQPNWINYDFIKNSEALTEVFAFFKANGKLLAYARLRNIFVGITG